MTSCSFNGETLRDFVTGRELPDTDDERIRQAVEEFLVRGKGYRPEEIELDRCFDLPVADSPERGRIDLIVLIQGRPFMAILCAPGSLVTRERAALAAARLADEVQIPFTVVTNGREAELLDTITGRVTAEGLAAWPDRAEAEVLIAGLKPQPLKEGRKEKEARIYLAFAPFKCGLFCH
ncbi:MAG: type I restriction enzyme HsdR N-terminal domain-containing protein [Thermodesulfobacteriota bacterium]